VRVELSRGASVLVAAALGLGLAAARLSLAALGPRYGGELIVAVGGFSPSGPLSGHGVAERLVVGLLHETLVTLDAEGRPQPSLTREWTSAADGREWRLVLDGRARFHEDAPVTAEDAVASLRRFVRSDSAAAETFAALLDGGQAFRSSEASELPGVVASDERQLALRCAAPCLALLASPAAAIVDARGRGAGPFAPTLEVPGRRLAARAHAGHVRGRPFLERVLVVARERAAVSRAVGEGTADAALAESGEPHARATLLLLLDADKPPFDSAALRAAADASIDRADLAARLIAGGAPRRALLSDGVPASPGPAPRVRAEQAVALDVDDGVPPLVSQRVVACLASLGLRVSVRSAPGHEIRTSGAQVRLLVFLPELDEPQVVLRDAALLLRLPAFAASLDAAGRLADPARRARLLELETELLGERRLVPLASLPLGLAARDGVHGLLFDPAGRLVVEDAWLAPR
jgi:MarR-like DNA-binding transcriptional regulator SgrR of sgrS sRNA